MNEEELPEGWAWTTLSEVATPSSAKVEPNEDAAAPYLSLEHIEAHTGKIIGRGSGADVKSTKAVFTAGDVLYGKLRPYLNKVAIPDFDGICSTDILVFPQSKALRSGYLFYFLSQREVVEFANHNSSGVQLPRISFKELGTLGFPLPPLAEQHRIVAAVERALAKVNAARDRLARVPATLKRFRQAVLAAACSGRLTADWREGNPNLDASPDYVNYLADVVIDSKAEETEGREAITEEVPPSWKAPRIEELFRVIDYRGKNPKKSDSGKRLITAKNIRDGFLIDEPVEFVSDAVYKRWMTRGFPKKGDIFFVTEGHTMGFTALNDRQDEIALAQRTLTLQPFSRLDTRLFLYFIMSQPFQRLVMMNASGSAAVGIKGARFRDLPIPFPPLPEQHEIVRRMSALFALADRIEAKVAAAKKKADGLTQAVLAKAFRGELVPTEAELARREGRDYEPADKLLERIRAERVEKPVAPKRRKV
jgi:type I restriction enzyme S subunit